MKRNLSFIFFLLFFSSQTALPVRSEENKYSSNNFINLDENYFDKLKKDNYLIGSGDTLKIVISRDYPELNTTTTVDGEGTIYLPKLSRIYVSGLTLNELSSLINKAILKYVKYPETEVEILTYRPIKVFVEGEVENPGIQILNGTLSVTDFPMKRSLRSESTFNVPENNNFKMQETSIRTFYFPTVFDAIRRSGGITPFSDLSEVTIFRKNSLSKGGGLITTKINFQRALDGIDDSQNIRVFDSDIIKISRAESKNMTNFRKAILSDLNSNFIDVYVFGRVNAPGIKTITKASTLNDAIDVASGAKVMRGKVKFVRLKKMDQLIQETSPTLREIQGVHIKILFLRMVIWLL